MNLGRRQDRRVACEEEFDRAGLRVRRFPAIDARYLKTSGGFETPGRYAHTLTTRLIIRRAAQLNAPAVFIFEDDVILHRDLDERLREIELPEDLGIFYLGAQHHERPEVVSRGLVRVRGALDTHAWGLRARWFGRVLRALRVRERAEDSVHPAADVALARLHQEIPTYAAFPNLAWQAEEHSDLLEGAYSSYRSDGTQKWAESVLDGLLAETFGGRAYQPAAEKARRHVAWFHTRALPSMPLENGRSPRKESRAAGREAAPVLESEDQLRAAGDAAEDFSVESGTTDARIAFLFLTRGDVNQPGVWEEYFSTANRRVAICGHAAAPDKVETQWLADGQICERFETEWAGISLVRVQLALLRAGLADERNRFFVFASESCVPIRPFEELWRIAMLDGRSRFHWETIDEVEEHLPQKAARASGMPWIPRSRVRFHSQWLMLDREAASLVVEDDLTGLFAEAFAPDECYAGTVLAMKGYPLDEKVARQNVTFARWPRGGAAHPRSFNEVPASRAADLAASGCFFARKFLPSSDIGRWRLHAKAVALGSCR